jgi:putative phage-type endonuclease
MDQGTPEWFKARAGKVTASRIADLCAKTKSGGYSTSRANYCAQLVVERMTGEVAPSFSNAAMEWGTECEPAARNAYSAKTGELVEEVGFFVHPRIEQSGASPDGAVGDDGLIEIKCPNTATHIETVLDKVPANKYLLQMQWQMACTNRAWCDFVSYDPRMPENLRLFVVRVPRDDKLIAELEKEVTAFLSEVGTKVELLMKEAA